MGRKLLQDAQHSATNRIDRPAPQNAILRKHSLRRGPTGTAAASPRCGVDREPDRGRWRGAGGVWKGRYILAAAKGFPVVARGVCVCCSVVANLLAPVEDVDAVEVLGRLAQALGHGLLARAQRHAGVVVLLVGLGLALGVANLALQVVVVLGLVLAHAVPEGPLCVGVDVHLDHAVRDRLLDVVDVGARTTVEDKGAGLRARAEAELLRDVLLRVSQNLRVELDVAGRVDAVHVAKGGGDGELCVGHRLQRLLDHPHLLGLGVEVLRVRILVVHPVLLAARDAKLHLEQHVELGHPLHVLDADGDVLLERLLGQVEHVRREERLAVRGVVRFRLGQHPVHPREELLGAVVCVQDHRHAVFGGERAHVVSARHRPSDGRVKVGVVEALASVELRASRRELDDDWRVRLARRLEASVDGRGRDAVDRRDGVPILLCVLQQVDERLARHDARVDRGREVGIRRHRALVHAGQAKVVRKPCSAAQAKLLQQAEARSGRAAADRRCACPRVRRSDGGRVGQCGGGGEREH
mmetsp:Transcript_10117/g.33287  ORF Transcript_10117/g.33287 Transcript_10117/m.33287 type:complete len:526 (-) Transcript_10117:16-1593(-)